MSGIKYNLRTAGALAQGFAENEIIGISSEGRTIQIHVTKQAFDTHVRPTSSDVFRKLRTGASAHWLHYVDEQGVRIFCVEHIDDLEALLRKCETTNAS